MILFSLCNRQVQFIIKPVAFPPVEINIWYNQQAMIKITVSPNEDKQRLDRFLRKYLKAAPLSLIYRLIRKDVKVNGLRAERDYMLAAGDLIELYIDEGQLEALSKKKEYPTVHRQFTIAYEDEDVLAVSKPFGLLVHGDAEEKKHTLANQVIDYLIGTGSYVPRIERTFVPSPVHRLDRNTTGLVLFGKQSIDSDAGQTGQMLAALADFAQATCASRIEIAGDSATVTREVDSGLETIAVTLPAVVTTDLRLNVLGVTEPAQRKAGVLVPDVATLLAKLREEAKII